MRRIQHFEHQKYQLIFEVPPFFYESTIFSMNVEQTAQSIWYILSFKLFLCTESTNNKVEILVWVLFPFTSQLDNIDIIIKVTKNVQLGLREILSK